MQQSGLRALVRDSLMWQKPINHPCSLTGALQHTLTPAHTQATCMSNHTACGHAPTATYTEGHAPFSPKTCPMIIPLKHTHACVHTHSHPPHQTVDSSILRSLHPSCPTLISAGDCL